MIIALDRSGAGFGKSGAKFGEAVTVRVLKHQDTVLERIDWLFFVKAKKNQSLIKSKDPQFHCRDQKKDT